MPAHHVCTLLLLLQLVLSSKPPPTLRGVRWQVATPGGMSAATTLRVWRTPVRVTSAWHRLERSVRLMEPTCVTAAPPGTHSARTRPRATVQRRDVWGPLAQHHAVVSVSPSCMNALVCAACGIANVIAYSSECKASACDTGFKVVNHACARESRNHAHA